MTFDADQLSSGGIVARRRQYEAGDVVLREGRILGPSDIVAEIARLDECFRNLASPWECRRCGCVFVPGTYRVIYWLADGDHDVEAVAYCPDCSCGILRRRPLPEVAP